MTDNLTVSRGVFLGSSGNDAAVGVAINSDHIIIAAGNVSNSGTLYRLSPQVGSSLLSQTDLGGTVSDLALVQGTTVGQQDRIVVVGSFGVKVYDPTGATVIWQQPGNFQEVAVTTNGTVITLAADKTLSLWSNTGTLLDSSNAIGGIPEDVAISQDGTQVYVTGYTQATANLQVPFIRAFNIVNNQISDTEAWDSWDFSASAVEGQSLGADSSGIQITIAQDGNLYFLGRTDGGTNVFQREPNAIGTAEAGIVNIDTYTNFSNTGSGSFTFYAQIDPSNGDVIKGQYLLTRLSAGGGNSYTPGAITVDGEGNVYVGGTAAASLPDRVNQQINGNPVAGYSGGDVALFSTSIDLGTRNFWTPFTTNSGTSGSNGSVVGVATGEGFQVLLATAEQPGELFAENGATPLGGNDIYLAVVDITPPSVVQLTPADNLTDVPLASDLQIQFTEGVQLGTGSVTIHRASDNSIVETIAMTSGQVNVSNDTVTINPTNDLAASTDYYVQLTAGAIEDLAGNDFAGIDDTSTWNFTTTQGETIVAVNFNGSYSQNFDTLATSNSSTNTTTSPWTNDSTLSGWFLFNKDSTAITTYIANNGGTGNGSFYSFGALSATSNDRALGGVGSGGGYFGSPASGAAAGWIAFAATNTTGATIDSLDVAFNGEQWRNGGNTTAQSMVLEYGFGTSFTTVSTWNTPGGNFNWTSPVATSTAAAVDGNTAGQVSGRGGTLSSLNWANNDTLWFRWIERNDAANDHGLAIDDFSLSLPPSAPTVNLSVSSNAGTEAGTTEITVTATASSAVSGNQTVNLAVTGTGITAGDYTLSNTTIAILNGQTTGSVTFTIADDALVEGTETATLTISNPSAGITLGTTASQNVTIADNDSTTPTSLDLANYVRIGRYNLPIPARTTNPPAGSELALEVSAITYNSVTDTLFVLGDEGKSIVQISKTGQLIDSMTLTASDFDDTEGLTYAGNSQFVLVEERLRQANLFTYTGGGTLSRANVQTVDLGTDIGNIGLEGLSFDPQTSGYIFVKEVDPQGIFQTTIDFGTGTASNGSSTTDNSTNLFDPALLELTDIADVFALSVLEQTNGNLLVLGQEDGKVLEVDRAGNILSTLTITADPGNPLTVTNHGFEGVTLDNNGLLYLTSESGGGDGDHPQVWVYAPSSYTFSNAAPVAVSVANGVTTLLENVDTTSAIKLGNIIVSDDSLGTNTLTVSDTTNFEIVGNELFLKAGTVLDFGTQSTYTVTIAVDDATLGSNPDATTTFTLDLQDTAGTSDLIISEVAPWSSGNSSLGADWFEVTNTGANAIDITGWVIDDDSANFASGSALSGVTSIAAGQSVVFVDGDAATITAFIDLWFGGIAPTGFTIGTYDGPGLGTGGDGVNLFNAAGLIVTGTTVGTSPSASPFATFDNAAGDPNTSSLSVAGTNGAFSVIDAEAGVILTGSPGTIAGTPTLTTTIGIVATGATASENGPTAGQFTLLRTGDTTNALDVTYSISSGSGNASNGTDYTAINATTATIPAGESQVTIAITPIDDNEVEGNESVTITLVDTDDYNLQPGAESATVTIEDNDTVLTILSLQITEFMYSGGDGEFIEFTNNDTSPVDMTGWSFSDSARVAGSFDLSTFGTVQPGESVILTEADAEAFRTAWNLSANTKIIGGLSQNLSRNDEINLYDAANNLVDRLTYGDGNFPGTIRTQNVSGWVPVEQLIDQEIDIDWVLSSVDDAQNSYTSTGGDIGNPGTYTTGIVSGIVPPVVNNFDEANTVTGWQSISVDADTSNTFTVSTSFSNAEANGFGDTAAANDWLISPAVNLDTTEDEIVSFSTQTSFTDSGIAYPQLSFLYSTNYSGSGDPTQATWTPLSFTPSPENSGQFTESGNIDISGISGTNVYFAFQYQSSGTVSGTAARWRVDSFNLRVDTPPPPPVTVKINEIQGSGDVSPLVGQTVTIEAIVVGDFQDGDGDASRNLRGFYVQEEDADADGNALTSEGIFIFEDGNFITDVNVGDKVQITGTVNEDFGETRIDTVTNITVISPGNPLPTAATITLPATATTLSQDGDVQPDLEAFEGMLVNFTDTLTISEMFNLDRFNEIKLVQGDRPVQFTQNNDPSAAGLTAHLQAVGARTITYDDGLSTQNQLIGNLDGFGPTFSTASDIRMGDTITGLSGVLSYQWAGNSTSGSTWRVRSTQNGENTFTKVNDRPATPEDVGGSLKVTGFNVLNYFKTIDLSGVNTAIGQDPRGADTADEFDRQTDKLVTALLAIDADVLGLVELENDFQTGASGNAIEFLVNELNAIAGAGTYAWIDPGTQFVGTDAIAVGLIYKPGAVNPVGDMAILNTAAFLDPNNTSQNRNRPAVAQTFEDIATGGTFTAVVNHLKSKGADGASGADLDQNDGQGAWNDTRTKAAQALVDWLNTNPTGENDSDYLLLGDFNAYAQEDPVKVLEAAGYVNLADNFSGGTATSYVFDGQVGTLDYAFASPSLFSQVTGATEWGINSDEADALDYNLDFGRDPTIADRTSPVRTSDHDPVIVGLNLVDEFDVTTPIDTNGATNTIAENATTGAIVGITANATDGDGTNNTVTYSLTDDAGGRFAINANTGVVTVASALDYETATSHNIIVQATSSDTSTATQTFTIVVTDVNEATNTIVSITPLDANKAEGNSGTTPFTFTVSRSGDLSSAVSVDYTVEGAILTAVVDGSLSASTDDFAPGFPLTGTIAFDADEASKVFTVEVAGDTTPELEGDYPSQDVFIVSLSNPSGGASLDEAFATGSIVNDDEPTQRPITSATPEDDDLTPQTGSFSGVNSLVFTGAGNDRVDIPAGQANLGFSLGFNRIFTGSDIDEIFVADGDRAFGGSGNDILDASDASGYRLSGGAGDDQFFLGVGGRALGGDGNETFTVGEDGDNLLSGGAGSDLFNILTDNPALFTTPNTIVDFTVGTDTLGILNQGVNFGFNDLTLEGNEIKVGSNTIAILVGVQTSTLTTNDFTFS